MPAPAAWLAALYIVFLARRDNLLELDARRRLYEHVQRFPGLHLSEIARAVDLGVNHAKYHLQYLEKHGLISSRQDDSYVRFFPRQEGTLGLRDTLAVGDKEVLALLRRPVPLHAVLHLLDRGTATLFELARLVGLPPTTLFYHMTRLEKRGIVASDKQGRERVYRLVDQERVFQLLMRYRPPDALVQGFLEAWEQLELP